MQYFFRRIYGLIILFLFCFYTLQAQYTNTSMLTSNGASVSGSGTYGLCLFCSVSNAGNTVDASTTNYASISIPVGVGGGGYIKIALPTTYPAGTRVGFVADVNGGVAGLFNGVTMRAYRSGSEVASVSGGSLINVLGIGGGTNINAVFCSSFDEVRIDMGSLVGLLASYRVYYAYVTVGGSFPVPCGSSTGTEFCGDNIDNDGDGLIDDEDVCVTCLAGTSAPILNSTFKTNTCPATTADLTTVTTSNLPVGAILTWHTGTPATTANKMTLLQTQSVAAGTYYAAFYDALNNCYSNFGSGTTAVTVSILTCCNGGSTAPSLSTTTKTNVCPAVIADLTTITASNTPSGASLSWHTGSTATLVNKMTTLQAQNALAGTYYAAFYDASNACFSTATTAVTATISTCFSTSAPASKTSTAGQLVTGNTLTELLPTGGTPIYAYSNDTGNPSCTAISGATAFSSLTVNPTTGLYSFTAPSVSGSYYYCIKVCDSATPTQNCQTQTYSLTVSASCTELSQKLNKQ
jgi:hypothetical protein